MRDVPVKIAAIATIARRDRAHVPTDRRVRRRGVLHAHVRGPRRPRQHAQRGRCSLPRPRLHPADRALNYRDLRREARLSAREAAGAREDTGGCRRGARRLLQGPRRRRQRRPARLGVGATQGERRAQRLGPVPDRGRASSSAGCGIIPALPAGGRRSADAPCLTTPYMKGRDVVRVQRALASTTTASTARSRRARPRPGSAGPDIRNAIDTTLTEQDQRYLLGKDGFRTPSAVEARSAHASRPRVAGVPERAVEEMERWIGLRERPAGSNKVPALSKARAPARPVRLLPEDGLAVVRLHRVPGCAPGRRLSGRAGAPAAAQFNALYCPEILAAAREPLRHARRRGVQGGPRRPRPLRLWADGPRTEHVGRVTRAPQGGIVLTVEGNSSQAVARRERPLGQVRAFVRDS